MKRYLLFDSGCCQCSKIAKAIEQEAGGKLTIRSLRDPAVKELLDRERPGWKWEPMLVEEVDDKVRIYAGGAMSRRLLVVLGPRRALKILGFVSNVENPTESPSVDQGRRGFLRLAGAAAISAVALMLPGVSSAEGGPTPITKEELLSRNPLSPEKGAKAIDIASQSRTFQSVKDDLPYSVAMSHPENDDVIIVIHSDRDIQRNAMPESVFITFANVKTDQVLLEAPISIALRNQDRYEVFIRDEHSVGSFVVTKQGTLLEKKITELQKNHSKSASMAPARIGDPIETGCNNSCICSLVCGSIAVWYCPVVGIVGSPIAGVICSIIFLVLCSWMCQDVPDQLLEPSGAM